MEESFVDFLLALASEWFYGEIIADFIWFSGVNRTCSRAWLEDMFPTGRIEDVLCLLVDMFLFIYPDQSIIMIIM